MSDYQGYSVLAIQRALNAHGFRLAEDGIMGPRTEAAISEFKRRNGWRARPWIGPLTAKALGLTAAEPGEKPARGDAIMPVWITAMNKWMYKHEVKHNKELAEFLKSDGRTLGDPSKLPWCGDWMETIVKLTLPDEPFTGDLGENPYWARNWAKFGNKSKLAYGAMIVIGYKKGGHICCAVGYDPKKKRIRIRGGNQSNMVKDSWISESKVIAIRKPKTWQHPLPKIPIMSASGKVLSHAASR